MQADTLNQDIRQQSLNLETIKKAPLKVEEAKRSLNFDS